MEDKLTIAEKVFIFVICFCLAFTCQIAIADPVNDSDVSTSVETNDETISEIQDKLGQITDEIASQETDNERVKGELNTIQEGLHDVSKKLDKLEKLEDLDKTGEKTNTTLEKVSSKLDTLITNGEETPIEVQKKLGTKAAQTYTVYAHASPNNNYAVYARQIIPKMDWDDDYIYFQDTSSSYVLVYGNLKLYSGGTVTGTQCHYVRWYYAGTGSGYLVQSGDGDVTINLDNYTVLSSLGSYPLLDDGFTLFRQEVCFYVLVAVVLYSLASVWGFLVRLRGNVSV